MLPNSSLAAIFLMAAALFQCIFHHGLATNVVDQHAPGPSSSLAQERAQSPYELRVVVRWQHIDTLRHLFKFQPWEWESENVSEIAHERFELSLYKVNYEEHADLGKPHGGPIARVKTTNYDVGRINVPKALMPRMAAAKNEGGKGKGKAIAPEEEFELHIKMVMGEDENGQLIQKRIGLPLKSNQMLECHFEGPKCKVVTYSPHKFHLPPRKMQFEFKFNVHERIEGIKCARENVEIYSGVREPTRPGIASLFAKVCVDDQYEVTLGGEQLHLQCDEAFYESLKNVYEVSKDSNTGEIRCKLRPILDNAANMEEELVKLHRKELETQKVLWEHYYIKLNNYKMKQTFFVKEKGKYERASMVEKIQMENGIKEIEGELGKLRMEVKELKNAIDHWQEDYLRAEFDPQNHQRTYMRAPITIVESSPAEPSPIGGFPLVPLGSSNRLISESPSPNLNLDLGLGLNRHFTAESPKRVAEQQDGPIIVEAAGPSSFSESAKRRRLELAGADQNIHNANPMRPLGAHPDLAASSHASHRDAFSGRPQLRRLATFPNDDLPLMRLLGTPNQQNREAGGEGVSASSPTGNRLGKRPREHGREE